MLDAVKSGEISKARLDSSVRKILEAKASLGLERARLVDISTIDKVVGSPENQALAQQISDDAITLVRENGKVLPLASQKTPLTQLPYMQSHEIHNRLVVVIFSADVRLESGRVLERQIRSRVPDAHIFYVDPRIAGAASAEILRAADAAEKVVTAAYIAPVAGARSGIGGVAATDPTGVLLQQILDHAAPKTMVVAVGNPYLASDFPAIQNYLCTFSTASISEVSAAKALFGEIPIQGHLPVTIPNVAKRGEGITRPASSTAATE
jgi:beta-N-acetylhexosaminidase